MTPSPISLHTLLAGSSVIVLLNVGCGCGAQADQSRQPAEAGQSPATVEPDAPKPTPTAEPIAPAGTDYPQIPHAAKNAPPAQAMADAKDQLQFIREMAPFPSTWLPDHPVGADPAMDAAFDQLWASKRGQIASSVTSEQVVEISGWAKQEMQGYSLPGSWLETLELSPLFASQSGSTVVFGTRHDQALKLPTHAAAVDRRLFVFAEYSTKKREILRVVVTIRGVLDE